MPLMTLIDCICTVTLEEKKKEALMTLTILAKRIFLNEWPNRVFGFLVIYLTRSTKRGKKNRCDLNHWTHLKVNNAKEINIR